MKNGPVNTIHFVSIDQLQLEVILDNGVLNHYSLSPTIHAHTYYELILCQQGTIYIESPDGSALKLTTPEVCLIPPGVYHRLRCAEPFDQKLAIRFYCSSHPREKGVFDSFFSRLDGAGEILRVGQQPLWVDLAAQLHRELLQNHLAAGSYARSLLTQLLILLLRQVCDDWVADSRAVLPSQVSVRRLTIDDYLNTYYSEPVTEETLAAHIHLSKRQLSRVLRQLYGKSFRQLLIDIRLTQAAQLLVTTDLTATEIAGRVGYGSDSGFYEAFKKRFGISVQKYRKEKIRRWDNV